MKYEIVIWFKDGKATVSTNGGEVSVSCWVSDTLKVTPFILMNHSGIGSLLEGVRT